MTGNYRMTYNTTVGNQIIEYQSPTLPGFTATANITATGNVEVLYAIISDIPTSVTFRNGSILFFSDILIPDTGNLEAIKYSFELPSTFNPLENFGNYHFWIWDEGLTGGSDFRELTASEIASAIVAWDSNSITVDFLVLHENNTSINIIFAITISSEGLLVPGYDIILILGAIGLGSIVIYIKKRRKLEI